MLSKSMADKGLARQQLITPIGRLTIEASDRGVQKIHFSAKKEIDPRTRRVERHLSQAKKEIEEYFSGLRKNFRFEVDLQGSSFEKKVWCAAKKIPFGKLVSYTDLAEKIGNSKAARAVGSALKKNPLPLAVPCHRVVSKSGDLAGFSGGLERKEWLIEHEV
ncbi:MAG: methylated-DNA--[protein]-cysteine S-methyltransferase [Bradymonadales bacterium]|nr:MAG: methylated-DNA--[protein]-cysteine S-methyltransferase [Bradymonadales bacterium]